MKISVDEVKAAYAKIKGQPIAGGCFDYLSKNIRCCPLIALYLSEGNQPVYGHIGAEGINWAIRKYGSEFANNFMLGYDAKQEGDEGRDNGLAIRRALFENSNN